MTSELLDLHYLHRIERLLENSLFGGLSLAGDPEAAVWLVRGAVDGGDERRAAKLVALLEDLAEGAAAGDPVVVAARHARALFEGDGATLRQVAESLCDPWDRASAAEDAGLAFAEHGLVDDALAQFGEAQANYERLGANEELARLRWRMRAVGVRRRHWRNETRPTTGWRSLTDSERHVAELVSQGLTNKEVARELFLSRHTVDYHLRHVFAKLDVTSRVQLARHVLVSVGATSVAAS
jgi:DNA-binding CsgD family transcriptional regulator